jgi:glyceraldehyde-3-phosphate dehydrogenase (ferredoxin)
MVLEALWKPVQREVFESKTKPWRTCGEPCPLACKKVWRGVKVDYEPSNALGPMIGVFDASDMAELVKLVDEMGLDAIEVGHIVSWIFDLLHRGMLSPGEVGVESRPQFDPLTVRVEDSSVNAALARRIIEGLIEHSTPILELIARSGARAAAARLDDAMRDRVRMHGLRFRDLLVYSAYGSEGYMTPNLYWAPGMVAPIPVPGRYWTVYTPTFMEPEEAADTAAERAMAEYLVDNAGFCRFHRKWVERLLESLYEKVYGVKAVLRVHAASALLRIYEYQERAGAEPRPWESRKTIDMVAAIAEEVGDREWASRIIEGDGAVEWWERFRRRFYEKLRREAGGG